MYIVKIHAGSAAVSANGLDHARTLARDLTVLRDGESGAWVEVRGGLRYVAVVYGGIRRILAEIRPA